MSSSASSIQNAALYSSSNTPTPSFCAKDIFLLILLYLIVVTFLLAVSNEETLDILVKMM